MTLSHRYLPQSLRSNGTTILLALASALLAVAFLTCTNGLFGLAYGYLASLGPLAFAFGSFIIIVTTSTAAAALLAFAAPEASGSGIPQLKAAYWKDAGHVPLRPVIVKFVAGVLTIGGGTSLGREGPTVYMGGGLASWLSGYLGSAKPRRRGPALVGAAAGLAAAFNTPLAAITFVLEEIVGDLSTRSIRKVLVAAIVGAFAVYGLVGRQPSFAVPSLEEVTWPHYALALVVAALASLLGVLFHRAALDLRRRTKGRRGRGTWLWPVAGALVTWVVGVAVFLASGKLGVFGLGYRDLSDVLQGNYLWWLAGILVVAKFLATTASYGFGGCGGIFSPTLFMGGLLGYFVGGLASLWVPLTPSDRIVLAAVGMGSCLGTVVKAPLSALLIVFEMTHQFTMIPGLLIGMAVSMVVSRLSGRVNFYDAILLQDGHELHEIRPPQDREEWKRQPVAGITTWNPVCLSTLETEGIRRTLETTPYSAYPVLLEGGVASLALRPDLEAAVAAGRPPELRAAEAVPAETPIHEVADTFVRQGVGMILVTPRPGQEGTPGIVTLHDLVRASNAVEDDED